MIGLIKEKDGKKGGGGGGGGNSCIVLTGELYGIYIYINNI